MSDTVAMCLIGGVVSALGILAKLTTDIKALRKEQDRHNRTLTVIETKADTAAEKALVATKAAQTTSGKVDTVITKLDANTEMTEAVITAINGHDNGVTKLEQINNYNHEAKRVIANALNALSNKLDGFGTKIDKVLAVVENRK